jgi:hypothetical protein
VSAPTTSLLRLAAAVGALLVLVPAASAAPRKTTTAKTTTAKTTTAKTTTAPVGARGKNCWSALIKDWYDGRIDKTYPVHCYKDALKNLPTDVKTYSDAYDVISRALADATRGEKTVSPDQLIEPPADQGGTKTTTTTGGFGNSDGNDGGNSSSAPPLGQLPGDRGATGVPVPLLILGGLALLLVAAGGAGLVARRIQARRGGPGSVA